MPRSAALAFVLALLLLTSAPALAGGWAVTTLDELPSELRAEQPYQVGYTLRQHGQHPYAGASTSIEIRSADGRTHAFAGRAEGAPGHYVAEVRFPAAGAWTWRVHQDWFGPQELGAVAVLPPAPRQPGETATAPAPAEAGRLRLVVPLAAAAACVLFGLKLGALVGRSRAGAARRSAVPARVAE
jgi:hypothetical protein